MPASPDVSTALPGVLTHEHLNTLNSILTECEKNKQLLEKARNAGTPLEHLEQQCQATIDVATGIKREFFPHHK